jgi:hypothetical protein
LAKSPETVSVRALTLVVMLLHKEVFLLIAALPVDIYKNLLLDIYGNAQGAKASTAAIFDVLVNVNTT